VSVLIRISSIGLSAKAKSAMVLTGLVDIAFEVVVPVSDS